jgi:signal transduction histidine kinase
MSDVAPLPDQDDLALAQQRLRYAETVRDVARSAEARSAAGEPLAEVLAGVADALMEQHGLAALRFDIAEAARTRLPDVRRGDVAAAQPEPSVSVPLGADGNALGWLRAWRTATAPAWTEIEVDTLAEVGREIGQLLGNTLADLRDHELVAELRALNAYKSDMVATVSHELKNPLAALLANLELLDHPTDPEERRRVLAAIERGAERMRRIVDDLQLLSAGETVRRAPVELGTLLRTVCEAAGDATAVRGQRLSLQVPAGPVTVVGDATELDRAVTNLLSNATKYSPAGTRIRVGLRTEAAEAVISVADEGIGISAEDQQRIFTEFFRSTDPEALAASGTGLGLAIVHRIVERHHGIVEVDSEPGAGSTFRLRIPLEGSDG